VYLFYLSIIYSQYFNEFQLPTMFNTDIFPFLADYRNYSSSESESWGESSSGGLSTGTGAVVTELVGSSGGGSASATPPPPPPLPTTSASPPCPASLLPQGKLIPILPSIMMMMMMMMMKALRLFWFWFW
jgi:hypothetical protein